MVEDMAEAVNCVEGEEVRVLGVEREIFKDGEDILDVLRWVVAQEQEIPRYQPPPTYDDKNYIPDRQVYIILDIDLDHLSCLMGIS